MILENNLCNIIQLMTIEEFCRIQEQCDFIRSYMQTMNEGYILAKNKGHPEGHFNL